MLIKRSPDAVILKHRHYAVSEQDVCDPHTCMLVYMEVIPDPEMYL